MEFPIIPSAAERHRVPALHCTLVRLHKVGQFSLPQFARLSGVGYADPISALSARQVESILLEPR